MTTVLCLNVPWLPGEPGSVGDLVVRRGRDDRQSHRDRTRGENRLKGVVRRTGHAVPLPGSSKGNKRKQSRKISSAGN